MSVFAFLVFNGLLLTAAMSDLRSFRIPNRVCSLLAVSALLVLPPASLDEGGSRLSCMALVALATLSLYLVRALGGGDVKLLIAASLWMPISGLPIFATTVGVAGGLQGVATLAAIGLTPADGPRARQAKVPYAVAIAGGGLMWSSLATFA